LKRLNQLKGIIVPRTSQSSQGFALVISLSLIAFVLLLLLSLSALLRVEIVNSSQQQQYLLARQNALVGLYQAVGELSGSRARSASDTDRRFECESAGG
jgi:type II secretory pathway component PulK